jgi:DNA-binding SARP family transcriptional activator
MGRYAILGPVQLCDHDRRVAVGGPRQVALLALLLVNANYAVSTDRLIDALWGDLGRAGALKRVQVAITRLRRVLERDGVRGESVLQTVAGGYLLAVGPGELDAEVFQTRLEEGRHALEAGEARRAREVLDAALGLWRGPALAAVAYEEFAQPEIRRLEELRLGAFEARVECQLQLGQHGGVIGELEGLVAAHPGRERLAAQLMLALYRCGRQGDALEVYARTRAYLVGELGVEPGLALRALQGEILVQSPTLQPISDAAHVFELRAAAGDTAGGSAVGAEPITLDLPRPLNNPAPAPPMPAVQARRVRLGLPLAAAHFTGRNEELEAIDEALRRADRAVVTQAITGLGGVGKSQLAARYVHKHADEYDVVAWIRAEDGGIADLSELAGEVGLAVAQLTPAQRAGGVLRWLSDCHERWLLVLDNVAAPEQLRDCCPSSGNGRVIVTTRDRAIAQFGPSLSVDVFDLPTAVEYLLATSGRTQDRDGATRLARALGFLPLALSHAGAYCAAGTSFDEYLQLLGALPAAELFDDHPEASYAQTVASTWQVSIQAAERQAPLARQVLEMAAYLAPDAIPRELFEVLLDDPGSASARKSLLDAFNALHRLSLAQIDDAVVNVHRLLQKTIRDDPNICADETAAVSALAAVAAAFPRKLRQPQTWPQCERLLPHALAIATELTTPGEAGQRLVRLLISAGEYLFRADPRARAVDTATRALACAQQILGAEHPDTLSAGTILAGSYQAAGRIGEAIVLGERTLADYERILGPEHPDTLIASTILALSYWDAGRTTDAIDLGERTLADCERILGRERPETLNAETILALCYWAAGRIGEAIELEERTLADCERILGRERPETLIASITLALYYAEVGRLTEAIELGERVVPDSVRILGPEHPDTLTAGTILAFSYAMMGRTGEAIELGDRVHTDCERILGPTHPGTLRARLSLAVSYRHAGRVTEAIELGERVLADHARLRGAEHPYTLGARAQLAATYARAGRTDAIELLECVLGDSERILGPQHPATLRARDSLTDAYGDAARTPSGERDQTACLI